MGSKAVKEAAEILGSGDGTLRPPDKEKLTAISSAGTTIHANSDTMSSLSGTRGRQPSRIIICADAKVA
jgi:hypothetical protein